MRFGLAAWGLRETPLEKQLIMAKELGISLLELGIGAWKDDFLGADAAKEDIACVRELFCRHGITMECACLGNDFDGDGADASLATSLKCIDIAGELGIKVFRIFAGFTPLAGLTPAMRQKELECLRTAAAKAASLGMVPAMETHGAVEPFADGVRHMASSSTHPETVAETLAAIPELALAFDPANLLAAGTDPLAFYRRFSDRIKYVHLKDFVRLPGGGLKGAACGEGALPWQELLTALGKSDLPAMIEYEQPADVRDGFERSLRFIGQCS